MGTQTENIVDNFRKGKLDPFWKHLFCAIFYANADQRGNLQEKFPTITKAVQEFENSGQKITSPDSPAYTDPES